MAKITIDALKVCPVVPVARVAAALDLLADGVDEITDNGSTGLDGRAAYGFASVIHSCAAELQKLLPPASAKKGEAK